MRTARTTRTVLGALIFVLGLLPVAHVWAQDPAPPAATAEKPAADKPAADKAAAGAEKGKAAADREGFQPVGANEQEHVPGGTLLVVAYAVAWLAIFGYLVLIWRRQGQVETELADLSRRVDGHKKR